MHQEPDPTILKERELGLKWAVGADETKTLIKKFERVQAFFRAARINSSFFFDADDGACQPRR
jgi:hypothetical protein